MPEIRRTYHDQLDELRHDVVRLGALATESIAAGTEVLLDGDLQGADRVISSDVVLDELTHSIEERSYILLARQQPVASDLRTIIAVMRTIHEVERAGDLMVNIAKTTRRLYPRDLPPLIRGILYRMGEQAGVQMRTAIGAFADEDVHRGMALGDMDDVMDELQRELFRAIFGTSGGDEADIHWGVQVALVGRYYERIADHAVNVGQRVAYMVTGDLPSPENGVGEEVTLS